MTPIEAADIIGCSQSHVRYLCRTRKLKHRCKPIPGGFVYSISKAEAKRYADTPQGSGWPRGQSHAHANCNPI